MKINPRILKRRAQSLTSAQRGGWTLIVLLIVVAIIAVLMAAYLPSVLETKGKDGQKKPVIQHVKDELAPIDQRNQQINEAIQGLSQPEENKDTQDDEYEYPE